MSNGSNPATTIGFPYTSETNRYGRIPTTVDTWPGPRKPDSRRSGDSRIALIGGTMVTWLQNTLKFLTPSARARTSVTAVDGAVVSNPTAKNTTWRSGLSTATLSASSGEYTNRTSAPRALASMRLPFDPGTRIMSPNVVKMTSGLLGQPHRIVDAAHRDHAHRAPGPVHQLDGLGQQMLDPVAVDGVRVTAAHLHEFEMVACPRAR